MVSESTSVCIYWFVVLLCIRTVDLDGRILYETISGTMGCLE